MSFFRFLCGRTKELLVYLRSCKLNCLFRYYKILEQAPKLLAIHVLRERADKFMVKFLLSTVHR